MATVDQKYLTFQFEGIRYKYICLPNSFSPAPRIFTKLMKPVLSSLRKKGHQVMNSLDDFFLLGDTFEGCTYAVINTCDLLIKLGFSIHPDKSQFIPVQKIEYLEFTLDSTSMTVPLTDIKQQKIKTPIGKTLQSKKLKVRQTAKILGTFEASLRAIKFGRLNMFYLQKCKNEALKLSKCNYEGIIDLTENCICELQLWQKSVDSVDDIYHPLPQLTIYSDDCLNGWGTVCGKHSTGGNWSKEESPLHINVLEIAAAFFTVKIYAATLSETSTHLRVDNTATLTWINRQNAPISERVLGVLC